MATYNYECTKCSHIFEAVVPIKERNTKVVRCVECKSKKTIRLFTPTKQKHVVAEGAGVESNKPDTYWKNAEENRVKRMIQKKKEELEKLAYDKAYRAKRELGLKRMNSFNESSDDKD